MNSHDSLENILRQGHVNFSPAQLEQLEQYQELILAWNQRLNLVAASTLAQLSRRHILDSAQLAAFLPAGSASVLDIGSGAGLPGLILAILCPQHKFILAEKIQKKASFLVTAGHKLGLANVRVHAAPVENLSQGNTPLKVNVVTARAVTALADLLDLSAPLLDRQGYWLLLKGEAVEQEINALKNPAGLVIKRHPSIVAPAGSVLVIRRADQTSIKLLERS